MYFEHHCEEAEWLQGTLPRPVKVLITSAGVFDYGQFMHLEVTGACGCDGGCAARRLCNEPESRDELHTKLEALLLDRTVLI